MSHNVFDPAVLATAYHNFDARLVTAENIQEFRVDALTSNPARYVASAIDTSENFQKILLAAHSGCGVSSLFNWLAKDKKLAKKYHMVVFSIADELNLADAEAVDVLFAVYRSLLHTVTALNMEEVMADFKAFVHPVVLQFGLDSEGPELLKIFSHRIRMDSTFRYFLRDHLKSSIDIFQTNMDSVCEKISRYTYENYKISQRVLERLEAEEVSPSVLSRLELLKDEEYQNEIQLIRAVKTQIGEVQTRHYRALISKYARKEDAIEVLIMVDDLDKLSQSLLSRILFEDTHLLIMPAAKIIWPLSISTLYSPNFFHIRDRFVYETLWPLSIYDLAGMPQEFNLDMLKQMIFRRLKPDYITEEAVVYLLDQSGGVLRDLNLLVQNACKIALSQHLCPIDLNTAQASFKAMTARFKRLWQGTEYKNAILKIAQTQSASGINSKTLTYLLRYNFVLEYGQPKETPWYDVHPWLKVYR